MAGSKKGERRGGAKPRDPTAAIGRKSGIRFDPQKGVIAKHRRKMTQERERQMDYMIAGNIDLMPRDAMLSAMRYYADRAKEELDLNRANMAIVAKTPAEAKELQAVVDAGEGRIGYYLDKTVDVAYKVAPYMHPRLAAIAVRGETSSVMSGLRALLDEIDEESRAEAKTIEHSSREPND